MPNSIKTKRAKKKVAKHSPKKIRNELTLCCALKAHNTLALGEPKKAKDQRKAMATFCHGRQPNHPSQIKLSCSDSRAHRRLFGVTSSRNFFFSLLFCGAPRQHDRCHNAPIEVRSRVDPSGLRTSSAFFFTDRSCFFRGLVNSGEFANFLSPCSIVNNEIFNINAVLLAPTTCVSDKVNLAIDKAILQC